MDDIDTVISVLKAIRGYYKDLFYTELLSNIVNVKMFVDGVDVINHQSSTEVSNIGYTGLDKNIV